MQERRKKRGMCYTKTDLVFGFTRPRQGRYLLKFTSDFIRKPLSDELKRENKRCELVSIGFRCIQRLTPA
ncbi:MAG: hypothetical protein D8M57_01595 [Candidatus Scalindua sp. AMX11]|nr:MAG: hypothetical protein DWQ00_15580 [Candidatus Scalindua sp.]TDE66756.1 MAG: hypothetical protein D8M57_01595 [Candidatus Scalindua sp. AMX11]